MKSLEAIKRLNTISAYQQGLFTTAQAQRLGVERHVLARLEQGGSIERLLRGIYRMGGAPSKREEDVLAVWLSLDPGREPGQKEDAQQTLVATGVTAAWLQQLGEVGPTPLEFCIAERKQTQRDGLIVRKRCLSTKDIVYVGGIPATGPERTLLDLLDNGEDLSLAANILHDMLGRGLVQDAAVLVAQIDSRGKKRGIAQGESLFEWLVEQGGTA